MSDMAPLTVRQRLMAINHYDPRLRTLLLLYLAVKAGLVIAAVLGHQLLPFNWSLYNSNLLLDVQQLPNIFRAFNTWDTQHYLFLSQKGYGINPMSNAFYPLYPYLIRICAPLFFNKELIAAYVIANAFSLLVPIYLYKLSCLYFTKEQAFRAAVLLMAFPSAFFMSVAYSESLYIALCLMAFYYLFKEDVLKSTVLCFLLPLARAQGLLFVVPITVLLLQSVLNGKDDVRTNALRAARTVLPPALATIAGMAVYFALCRWKLGGFFAGLNAQQLFPAKNSLGNLFSPYQWLLNNFVNIHMQLHGSTNSALDRAAFLVCLPVLIGVYRTQPKALFAYTVVTMLVPALAGSFMSYTRMLLVVFPLFIYLSARFRRSELLAIPMFTMQVLFYLLHTGGYWVA